MDWYVIVGQETSNMLTSVISLEFRNLQQLIYTDLANNIRECKDEDEVQPTVEFIHASLDSHSTNSNEKSSKISEEDVQRIYMVCPTPQLVFSPS